MVIGFAADTADEGEIQCDRVMVINGNGDGNGEGGRQEAEENCNSFGCKYYW